MADFINLMLFLVALGTGYFFGSRIEKKHYQEIEAREQALHHLPAVTGKNFLGDRPVAAANLVSANVVICTDYFKLVTTALRNILGGRVMACESLVDRARREAILRLKERSGGADIIINLRVVSSRIGEGYSVEALAYGTAVTYSK